MLLLRSPYSGAALRYRRLEELRVNELGEENKDLRDICSANGIQYEDLLAARRHKRAHAQCAVSIVGASSSDACRPRTGPEREERSMGRSPRSGKAAIALGEEEEDVPSDGPVPSWRHRSKAFA